MHLYLLHQRCGPHVVKLKEILVKGGEKCIHQCWDITEGYYSAYSRPWITVIQKKNSPLNISIQTLLLIINISKYEKRDEGFLKLVLELQTVDKIFTTNFGIIKSYRY